MQKDDLKYTTLEYIHNVSSVDYNAMLEFYCMKLMEHYKWEVDHHFVELNGRKYHIHLSIDNEE